MNVLYTNTIVLMDIDARTCQALTVASARETVAQVIKWIQLLKRVSVSVN